MTKHYFDLEVIKLRTFPAKLRSSLAVLIIVSRRALGAGLLVLVILAPWEWTEEAGTWSLAAEADRSTLLPDMAITSPTPEEEGLDRS